jgi:lipopolysaccharide biosynthesis glycosyltransferase
MIVVYCFTEAWAKYIPTQLFALHATNPSVEKVYLISDAIPADVRDQIAPYNCKHILPAKIFNQTNVARRFGISTLWRLLITRMVPHDRCIYLDADTLVVDDISELAELRPDTVAGAIDTGIPKHHVKALGHTGNYINAGVLAMNLANIRRDKLVDTWIKMANGRKYDCQDQDIINMTTTPLIVSNQFNSSVSTGINPAPKIVHYAGKKTRAWVSGMRQGEHWQEWQAKYDSENDRLRMVRQEPQAAARA